MATFSSPGFTANAPAITEGNAKNALHGHDTVSVTTAMVATDVLNFFYLPPGAVVTSFIFKAQSQIDSNGAPLLSWDLGITGATGQFLLTSTTPGRTAGSSFTNTFTAAGAGVLYKNTSSAKVLVLATCKASPATAVAGVMELSMTYYIEEPVGSQA